MIDALLQWWNLLFTLPFAGAVAFILLQAVTGLHGEASVDHDVDHEVDLDHGVDHEAGHDVGHDADHDHDAEQSELARSLSFLGVGRVPLSTLVTTLLILWGATGWISNQLLEPLLRTPLAFVPLSCLIALTATIFGTRWTARLLGKLVPATETYVARKSDLVDRPATVRFKVTETSGSAMVLDPYGNLLEVSCRVKAGKPPIPPGTEVILYERDEERDLFFVAEAGLTEPSRGPSGNAAAIHTRITQANLPKEKIQ